MLYFLTVSLTFHTLRPETLLKIDSSTGVFLWICEISMSSFFIEHLQWLFLRYWNSQDQIWRWFFLSHFIQLVFFSNDWKYQKTSGFLMFSGGIMRDQSHVSNSIFTQVLILLFLSYFFPLVLLLLFLRVYFKYKLTKAKCSRDSTYLLCTRP